MDSAMGAPEPWAPWEILQGMKDSGLVTFEVLEIVGGRRGFVQHFDDGSWRMVLDSRLTARAARCVLSHELVHVLRGAAIGQWVPDVLEELEEFRIGLETAGRLVPPRALTLWALGRLLGGQAVTLAAIAEAFDVEEEMAATALSVMGSPWISGYGLLTVPGEDGGVPAFPIEIPVGGCGWLSS